jgi:hypothetical protein
MDDSVIAKWRHAKESFEEVRAPWAREAWANEVEAVVLAPVGGVTLA